MTDDLAATEGYVLNHTMLRIKDPARSLPFYETVLGMRLRTRLDFDDWKFTLYFLEARGNAAQLGGVGAGSIAETFARPGLLELTHNWGTESGNETMHSGNEPPKGYGHICISVPDIAAACARFEAMGATFQKRLGEGGMRDIAFLRDPDGYWIEIVEPGLIAAAVSGAQG